jgi:hypothetical protein
MIAAVLSIFLLVSIVLIFTIGTKVSSTSFHITNSAAYSVYESCQCESPTIQLLFKNNGEAARAQ